MADSSNRYQQVQWQLARRIEGTFAISAQQQGVTPLQAQLLSNRGITNLQEMRNFLYPNYKNLLDPFLLPDMHMAVERVKQAFQQSQRITVYGDYDADGVTSSALLTRALRDLWPEAGKQLDHYIPSRLNEGCGLNQMALDELIGRGTRLIITTDNASSDVEQIAYAKSQGIDVIVTDHHHPPEHLPAACAMVNPFRLDSTYSEHVLCGAGVAFKLVQALYRSMRGSDKDAQFLLDLVAIGTIADVAALVGENHVLTTLGLGILQQTQKPGLRALITHSSLKNSSRIKEKDIAFSIAPRINAAGRMGNADLAFQLLTTDDAQEAEYLVARLEGLNTTRKEQTERLMIEVRKQAEDQRAKKIVLVHGDGWSEGIIGLVAGRLSEEINKTVLVVSTNQGTGLGRGSVRSQANFHSLLALRGYNDLKHPLERYGGHKQAAGFTIKVSEIEDLHNYLLAWERPASIKEVEGEGEEQAEPGENINFPSPQALMIDYVFDKASSISYQIYQEIRQVGPFGAGNPEPIFKVNRIGVRRCQINRDGRNLGIVLEQGLRGSISGGAHLYERLKDQKQLALVFAIEPAWHPQSGESAEEIRLRILAAEPAQ